MATNECFICGRDCIASVFKDDIGENHYEIGEAVHFSANGNWASSLWDPMSDSLSLNIYICDGCLAKHRERATVVRHERHFRELERVQWDKWRPKR